MHFYRQCHKKTAILVSWKCFLLAATSSSLLPALSCTVGCRQQLLPSPPHLIGIAHRQPNKPSFEGWWRRIINSDFTWLYQRLVGVVQQKLQILLLLLCAHGEEIQRNKLVKKQSLGQGKPHWALVTAWDGRPVDISLLTVEVAVLLMMYSFSVEYSPCLAMCGWYCSLCVDNNYNQ
jgi:hypothetical protein